MQYYYKLFEFISSYIVKLPELTKEGYEVVVGGLYHDDATDFSFTDFYKFFIMAIESWAFMREDNAEGLIVLGDASNFTFSHLKKLEFGVVKTGFQYFQVRVHLLYLKMLTQFSIKR